MKRVVPFIWRHPWMKLTADDVRLICALREGPNPLPYSRIAEKFEISIPTAHRVARRHAYKWVV